MTVASMGERALCNMSVATVPLREVVPAAAAAGFTTMSIAARAQARSGMSDASLASLLAAHGVRAHDVEATFDWIEPFDPGKGSWLHPVYDTERVLAIGEALGASTVVAVHFGSPSSADEAAAAFARLCDRAGERGMQVALEYVAFATISDLATAWQVVRDADQPNGGLLVDVWHHRRSLSDDALLDRIPAERILSVQVSDGAAKPEGTLVEDLGRRRLPGAGDFEVSRFVERLGRHGVACPIGIEVLDTHLLEQGTSDALQVLHDALARVVRSDF